MAYEMQEESELELHEGQQEVFDSRAPTRVVAAGRRWGGSTLIARDVFEYAMDNSGKVVWVFAPTHRMARLVFDRLKDLQTSATRNTQSPPYRALQTVLRIKFYTDTEVRFLSASAEPPKVTHRGELPDYVAVDNAERIERREFEEIKDVGKFEKADKRLFVGTPFGYAEEPEDEESEYPGSWMFDYFKQGFMVGSDTECWHFTTAENPLIEDVELQRHWEMLSDERAGQEYGARWLPRDDE